MRKRLNDAEAEAFRELVEPAKAAVKKELVRRVRAKGMTTDNNLDLINGDWIRLTFDAYGVPGWRNRTATMTNDGQPIIAVTAGYSGDKLYRRMAVDGSFPYDEFVKWIERKLTRNKQDRELVTSQEQAKTRTEDFLSDKGIHLQRSFGTGCHGHVEIDGDVKFIVTVPADDHGKLNRLIEFLKTEFAPPVRAAEGGE